MRRPARFSSFLSLLTGLWVALGAGTVRAQILGEFRADVPFQFHAGDATLPAGTYLIRTLDDIDLSAIEIRSLDGDRAAILEVRPARADTHPSNPVLLFDKCGNRYVLSRLFDEGTAIGSELPKSHG